MFQGFGTRAAAFLAELFGFGGKGSGGGLGGGLRAINVFFFINLAYGLFGRGVFFVW